MDAVNAKSESNNFPGCLNLGPEDQIVQINNFIVSFDQFKRSLRNLDEIVENLKLVDKNYAGKDHEECAHDYYMAFYLTPEIRQKYKFKLRPCATDFQDRLLALPSNKWSTN
ncbi:protein telomere ends associated-like isoform X2 [Drosophila ficusphila]|uniref:protein telomere ends associated-like isoform X2 n=1 Tax=Drosophila ficusphila TaxID=30025 RepID=UPI0007E8263A|nr:protein telomere ends associated-like isoform X2 [Drosophila ficusphila]